VNILQTRLITAEMSAPKNRSKTLHILVTGGAGFIGSHACKALAAAGHTPIAYDNLSRGNAGAVKWGPLEKGDIADASRLNAVLDKYRPTALMHFAAYAYVGESVQQPLMYYQNNFAGTAAMLNVIAYRDPIPVVFSSTCATYGIPDRVPIDEDQRQNPINPYGRSKLFVEHLLRDLGVAHGLPWVALRYFNAAGADPDGEIGERHDPETHLIPLAIAAALTGKALKVFGADYHTPDGTCVRDFIHVTDIADAHVRALNHLVDGGASCALNLANTRGCSVREVIATVEKICGHTIPVEYGPRREGDPAILVGEASRARALIGWMPTRSALETQISDAWKWFEKQTYGRKSDEMAEISVAPPGAVT
jgi:UDP-arabinose 4-epimerase